MRCASCNADNPPKATACEECGASLARRPRRRGVVEESDTPFGPIGDGPNRRALVAYRFAIVGLIPVVGVLAGPAAVLLGCHAWLRDRHDVGFNAWGPLQASLLLGVLGAVANGIGLTLVALAWWQPG
jgi:hypothetical protein